ncbi:acetylornithine deacetylase [Lutibaculum baratangense]|uniref:Acetylornithine deacetylase n=1 Tax=Lutibaculum baratangense AMV1 TaxID=631454 RepID=V4RHH7_9HYPH|nr:acetylornithine deacetylase [Lutibaculum baratangense]ESR25576.1 Acetylornithine deacetylase [Lutibaculum baratangense AMV1]
MPPRTSAELLADLVAFDTTSRNPNLELISYVEAYLQDLGIPSERVPDETGEKANLWATIGPDDVPGIILSGHTDVVPVDGQDWTSDPFTLTERNGRLYGRGSTDMKGFLACCLSAVPAMRERRLARPVHLAFSCDEEVGCVGVRTLLDRLAERAVKPRFCVVGEPTSMRVMIGHKGKRSMRVSVHGRACHSSLAPQGVNAVDYAAMLVLKIREIGRRFAQSGARDEGYDVPYTTAHTGIMAGGTALNIVPDFCTFDCEFRALPSDDADALVEELRRYAKDELEPEMKAIAPEAGIEIDVFAAFPGVETRPDEEITRLAQGFAEAEGWGKVAYGTEGGLFQTRLGVETVICGPGSIAQAHKPDEFIARSELDACDRFIGRLVGWAAG